MNEKEKQIEEMATDVCRCLVWDQDGYATVDCLMTAENLHHIGYRKQRAGEWIFNKGRTYGESAYYCSNCWEGESYYGFDKFCPSCGAKMGGCAE